MAMLMNSTTLIVPHKLLAALFVALMGLGSWIVVNGLWYEIPLLVNVLPEGWNLPAYLSIFIQVANIFPLLYVPLTKLCRKQFSCRFRCLSHCLQPSERLANYVILSVGFLSCILLANLWDVVLPLRGLSDEGVHSVVLLTLALLAATVDCISTVTFITYLTGMPNAYVAALSFGEALSDLLPSSLALVQGIGETVQCVNQTVNGTSRMVPVFAPPRFPVSVFLYCLSGILAVSLTAFALLDASKFGLGHYVTRNFQLSLEEEKRLVAERSASGDLPQVKRQLSGAAGVDRHPTLVQLALPVLLLCSASMISFGFLPALQSYSSAAYSQQTFHLSVNLSGLATALLAVLITWIVYRQRRRQGDPESSSPGASESPVSTAEGSEDNNTMVPSTAVLSSSAAVHRPSWATEQDRARPYWLALSGFLLLPTGHIIYLAASSPSPPHLAGLGPVLAVISWILIRTGFSGLRTWIWLFLNKHCHKSMTIRIAGMLSQIGSAVGAVISFLLVVRYQIFAIKPTC